MHENLSHPPAFESIAETCTGDNPLFSVIWLHGLGADASDFRALPGALGLRYPTRFVFPNAPSIPVTVNGGMVSPAWYNILQADSLSRVIDEDGLQHTADGIWALVAQEVQRGIPVHHVFLAGFSQGGAVAYYTALTQPELLAGVVALSTYLPTPLLRPDAVFQAPRELPIFSAHGAQDDVVSLDFGHQAIEVLSAAGFQPLWSTFPMDHAVSIAEVRALGRWLNQQMADLMNPEA